MPFIFYDTETTGVDNRAFVQILQFAAIRTNDELEIEDETAHIYCERCRRLPHVVPEPGALLVTDVDPTALENSPSTHYETIRTVAAKLADWSPAVFMGYNSISYDETLLRSAFFQTLHPIYLTNTGGSTRADLMSIVQAAATHAPTRIVVPRAPNGSPVFKLGQVAQANGIPFDENEAHDALYDVRTTLALARYIRERVPEVWTAMLRNSRKTDLADYLANTPVVCLTNYFFGREFCEVVTSVSSNPDNDNEVGVFNLAYAPEGYLGLGAAEISTLLSVSPKVIRIVRLNKEPCIMSFESRPTVGRRWLDPDEYARRANAVRTNRQFCDLVAEAIRQRREQIEPKLYVEEKIYDSFPSPQDGQKLDQFHQLPWPARRTLCDTFEDARLRELGVRLIYVEHPEVLAPMERAQLDVWCAQRVVTDADVPWMTVPKAMLQLQDLQRTATADMQVKLSALEDYLLELGARYSRVAAAARA